MVSLMKMREIASETPLPIFEPQGSFCSGSERSSPMLKELVPPSPSTEGPSSPASPSLREYPPLRLQRPASAESERHPDPEAEKLHFLVQPGARAKCTVDENKVRDSAVSPQGRSLFQEWFFFCRVKNIGDVPGTGCIYVETVVDRDSGVAFAKVYPAKSAMNAVDILTSRVLPYFESQGIAISEIHTRKTSEYSGLPTAHPFETFLSTSRIRHLEMDHSSQPYNHLCEQFYRFLLKEFFPLALRRHFQLSLFEMQNELDAFVDTYNAMQLKGFGKP